MPQLAGPLVEHKFRKTTIVGNAYVFFPGKVQMPKHVHSRMLLEKEAAQRKKEKEEQQLGLSAEEIAGLEAGAENEGAEINNEE
jgi:hypothetical protein